MDYINFNRTTNKTNALSGETNTIYFPTDAASIIMNGKEYGVTDISGKQDVLTAGSNIQINGTTISATDTIYDDSVLSGKVSTIEGEIPAQASSSNQLADKNFVNSSIATSTATFKGTYSDVASLANVTADTNDYGFVTSTDAAGNTLYNRYKYDGTQWLFEYSLNNSSFTSNQWATVNSGATAQSVSDTASHLVDTTVHVTTADKTKWDAAEPNVQSDWNQSDNTADDYIKNKPNLATVATSGSYNDLSDKPTIPTAQVNSDWNSSSGVSEILNKPTIPSKTSDLTNDSGFITGYTETDPTVPAWAKGVNKPTYTASEVGALPDNTVIPSKTSDLTNDSGFLTQHQELKTINGQSLIGTGNITISGGGADASVYAKNNDGNAHITKPLSVGDGVAGGVGSVASGYANSTSGNVEAAGVGSQAFGIGTKATQDGQMVCGKCNVVDEDDTFQMIVGNGADDEHRSNAFGVTKSGSLALFKADGTPIYLDAAKLEALIAMLPSA